MIFSCNIKYLCFGESEKEERIRKKGIRRMKRLWFDLEMKPRREDLDMSIGGMVQV